MAEEVEERESDLERSLGRTVRIALPILAVLTAVALGLRSGMGPAILALAAATLLGAVLLLWSSLRSLVGDAPLDPGFDEGMVRARTEESERRKRQVLRALKDLEQERDIGKIDEEDYAVLSAQYRATAKALLREMDAEIAPFREKAEQLAKNHLKKKGLDLGGRVARNLASEENGARSESPERKRAPAPERVVCASCGVSNDDDAAFCKKCGAKLTGVDA